MPKKAKSVKNMSKHMTKAEAEGRAAQEEKVQPTRTQVHLTAPDYVEADELAKHYWQMTLARLQGVELLDDLDSEMLAVYCSMLSRRDRLNTLCSELLDKALSDVLTPSEQLKATDALDGITSKLGGVERTILSYADKLGLTPSGRVGLAKKKAAALDAACKDDLFGD